MNNNTSKSQQLLDKVYTHLDSIDVTKLSMNELKDFLEVVQKGRFLESYGTMYAIQPPYGFGGCASSSPTESDGDTETKLE